MPDLRFGHYGAIARAIGFPGADSSLPCPIVAPFQWG